MIEPDEPLVAIPRAQIRPFFREDVRVDVDLVDGPPIMSIQTLLPRAVGF